MQISKSILWTERVSQWLASGLSQPAYAAQSGVSYPQLKYWSRRLSCDRILPTARPLPALLPVRLSDDVLAPLATATEAPRCAAVASSVVTLRGAQGWTLTLSSDIPASWLSELMRGL